MAYYLKLTSSRRLVLKAALGMGSQFFTGLWQPVYANYASKEAIELDIENRQKAKYHMVFGSPYDTANAPYSPHMHIELKNNIEQMSNGFIYVDVRDQGQLGVGTELMSAVSRGRVSAALVSASNLSPIAPELDLLNIPFWSAQRQKYVNLVTSKSWKNLVLDKIKQQGHIEVLFHHVVGARTATTTKNYLNTIKHPKDIENIAFRIPASKVLNVFYQLAGATPVKALWKNVAKLARAGQVHALDPSVIGLYNGPDNLKIEIGVVSEIESVHDGWVTVISQQWFKQLSPSLQLIVKQAGDKTFREHLKTILTIEKACQKKLRSHGAQIYYPTKEERQVWINRCGHSQEAWLPIKKQILGEGKLFEQLVASTYMNNGYYLTKAI